MSLSSAAIDQLGERLRAKLTIDDLRMLDRYRREFGADYSAVVDAVRVALDFDSSGRPAKSTSAIVDKLNRGSMRLSQMQDVAGCRLVVADTIAQDAIVSKLTAMFQATVLDRRVRSSHGYRAVHIIVRPAKRPVEVQVRTTLQHLWAEFSEKAADRYGIEVKYGGGNKVIRKALDETSDLVARFESLESRRSELGQELARLQRKIEEILLEFLAVMREQ